MDKIKTIFDRDWKGNRGVIPKKVVYLSADVIATEKVDGTNVRLTVRNHRMVRLEKRRNPTKREKLMGIETPWYIDADEYSPQDKYIWEAAKNTALDVVPDGEWSGEAFGEKIQGNPLKVEGRRVFLFSLMQRRESHLFREVPVEFEKLKEWLPKQKSTFNPDCPIEGIVWWDTFMNEFPVGKIKQKDFKEVMKKPKEEKNE